MRIQECAESIKPLSRPDPRPCSQSCFGGDRRRGGKQERPGSATFSALADPTRGAILARLASGEASVTDLAEPFRMSMPAVSKHLKVLERAGLIVRGREAQWRPCRLDAVPLREVANWVESYRGLWEQSFDRLERHLGELKKEKEQEKKHGRKRTR